MSVNVRSEIQNAVNRKRLPAFTPGSVNDLALKLGMPFPVSLRDLLRTLNELLPASVTYDSGRFAAGNVHASGQLYFQSDGGMLFSGQAHESGVVGDNFLFAMLLVDVKDASGKPVAFVHTDTLAGQLLIGFSDKEWHDPGFNQLVKDNWDAVKHTRVRSVLSVSIDPWQVTEATVLGAFAVVGAAALGFGIAIGAINATEHCSGGESWKCATDPKTGEFICRCEYN